MWVNSEAFDFYAFEEYNMTQICIHFRRLHINPHPTQLYMAIHIVVKINIKFLGSWG